MKTLILAAVALAGLVAPAAAQTLADYARLTLDARAVEFTDGDVLKHCYAMSAVGQVKDPEYKELMGNIYITELREMRDTLKLCRLDPRVSPLELLWQAAIDDLDVMIYQESH